MGYEMNVSDCSLVMKDTIYFAEYYHEWDLVGNNLEFADNYYNANTTDELMGDLDRFQKCGVRGHFIVHGEQGEWIKYVLSDNGVQEYNATLLWGDDVEATSSGDEIQATLTIGIEDIKGCLIDDIANPVAMEKVASLMDDKEWIQNIINIMQKRLSLLDWNEVLAEAISDNL